VLGAGSNTERDLHMAALLDQGFGQSDVPVMHRARRIAGIIATAHAATLENPRSRVRLVTASLSGWGIQLGSYATARAAHEAAALGRRAADGGETRIEAVGIGRRTLWRAQVTGLSASDAQEACGVLGHRRVTCTIIRTSPKIVASR
jgi:hypothetical protein